MTLGAQTLYECVGEEQACKHGIQISSELLPTNIITKGSQCVAIIQPSFQE